MKQTAQYLFIIIIVFFTVFAGILITPPTQEQIDACVASSNYTAEECLIELTR